MNSEPMDDDGLYKGKYRISPTRLQHWDYRWGATYFITICTKNREHFFGEIEGSVMQLSHIGVLADVFWHEIKNHSKNVELGQFVVMPNHIHGILILENQTINEDTDPLKTIGQNRFQNQGKGSVSSLIGSYKSAVSKHAHRLGHTFEWQAGFHDHIVRDDASYQRIKKYIANNPAQWGIDKFNTLG